MVASLEEDEGLVTIYFARQTSQAFVIASMGIFDRSLLEQTHSIFRNIYLSLDRERERSFYTGIVEDTILNIVCFEKRISYDTQNSELTKEIQMSHCEWILHTSPAHHPKPQP